MKNKEFVSTKGITLVALVVTIIVLIILAGVSINLVMGENGVLTKAQEARRDYQLAANLEQAEMENAAELMNEIAAGSDLPQSPAPTYTITYNANGGEGTMEGTSEKSGRQVTIKENEFTKVGYSFESWNTKSDGTGTKYAKTPSNAFG